MLTLLTVLILTGAFGVLTGAGGSHPDAALAVVALVLLSVPVMAYADLSGTAESGARSPFLSALVFALVAPVYFGLLPHSLTEVLALAPGAQAPLRFVVEFGLMAYVPLALMMIPVIRLFGSGRPSMPGAVPAGWLYQGVAVLMVGVISLIAVAASGIIGFSNAPEITGLVSTGYASNQNVADPTVWSQVGERLAPFWFVGMLMSVFALAWGQLGSGRMEA